MSQEYHDKIWIFENQTNNLFQIEFFPILQILIVFQCQNSDTV